MRGPVEIDSRLALRRGVRIVPADQGRWQIRADFEDVSFLEGAACERIIPWLIPRLDGTHSVAELMAASDRPCTPQQLTEVLHCLWDQRCLVDAAVLATSADGDLAAAFASFSPDPQAIVESLRAARVAICGRSPLAESILHSCQKQGLANAELLEVSDAIDVVQRTTDSSVYELMVAVETDWPVDDLERFNAAAIRGRQSWLLVGAWNQRLLVGPIFLPGLTACYACYRRRLDSHRQQLAAHQAFDLWQRGQTLPIDRDAVLPSLIEMAAAWTSLEIVAHLTDVRTCRTRGRVLVYYPDEVRLDSEVVLRIPWCPACSE